MRRVGAANYIVRVHQRRTSIDHVVYRNRNNVMDVDSSVNRPAVTRQVHTIVSSIRVSQDDLPSEASPLRRCVKNLIQLTMASERFDADRSANHQRLYPILKLWDQHKLIEIHRSCR